MQLLNFFTYNFLAHEIDLCPPPCVWNRFWIHEFFYYVTKQGKVPSPELSKRLHDDHRLVEGASTAEHLFFKVKVVAGPFIKVHLVT